MMTEYLTKQMNKAKYKILADGAYFGEISGLRGVWASAKNLEDCRNELLGVLEDWLVLKLRAGEKIFAFQFKSRRSALVKNA